MAALSGRGTDVVVSRSITGWHQHIRWFDTELRQSIATAFNGWVPTSMTIDRRVGLIIAQCA
jgi:hypothetical protein